MKKIRAVSWNWLYTPDGAGNDYAVVGGMCRHKKVKSISTCTSEDRAWITFEGNEESTLTVFNINEIKYEEEND